LYNYLTFYYGEYTMGKLHELLAVEKSKSNAAKKLITETTNKFGKFEYFQGHIKRLKMMNDSTENKAIESAANEARALPTTVHETLDYTLKFWADAEDVILQKNITNQRAVSDIVLTDGTVIAQDIPVDELLGLETRLEELRRVMDAMPTLPAAVSCKPANDGRKGSWVAEQLEVTTKTEKTMVPVVLYEATKEHPAQVKEVASDRVVGTFEKTNFFGAASSAQKAEVIARIDSLVAAVKQARMRANSVEADKTVIGKTIVDYILNPFSN
jgi:hypothetical protein